MNDTVGRLRSLFPSHQLDVIVGSLLGDARLECRSIGVRSPITARFRVHHGFKQKEYVFWKHEVLKDLVAKGPREISWINPKRGLHEVSWYFHTKSLEELGILHSFFYRNKRKVLPEHISELLNPMVLAVWFMDDGSNNKNGLTINTHGFEKEEQEKILKIFKDEYSINATLVKDRNKWKIAIGKSMNDFLSIIEPYVIPAMSYKIISPRNDLSVISRQSEKNILANTSVPRVKNLEKV